jgi:hypothetical protein
MLVLSLTLAQELPEADFDGLPEEGPPPTTPEQDAYEARWLDCRPVVDVSTTQDYAEVEVWDGTTMATVAYVPVGPEYQEVEIDWALATSTHALSVEEFATAVGDEETLNGVRRERRNLGTAGVVGLVGGLALTALGTAMVTDTAIPTAPLTAGVGVAAGGVMLVASGGMMLGVRANPDDPASLWYTQEDALLWVTSHNELLRRELGLRPEEVVRFESRCGTVKPGTQRFY